MVHWEVPKTCSHTPQWALEDSGVSGVLTSPQPLPTAPEVRIRVSRALGGLIFPQLAFQLISRQHRQDSSIHGGHAGIFGQVWRCRGVRYTQILIYGEYGRPMEELEGRFWEPFNTACTGGTWVYVAVGCPYLPSNPCMLACPYAHQMRTRVYPALRGPNTCSHILLHCPFPSRVSTRVYQALRGRKKPFSHPYIGQIREYVGKCVS